MLEGVVTNGHFDVVVIELIAFFGGRFFCRSIFGAYITKVRNSVEWDGAGLIRHIELLSPVYWGVGGSSDGCNTGGTRIDAGLDFARPDGPGTVDSESEHHRLFRRIERRRDAIFHPPHPIASWDPLSKQRLDSRLRGMRRGRTFDYSRWRSTDGAVSRYQNHVGRANNTLWQHIGQTRTSAAQISLCRARLAMTCCVSFFPSTSLPPVIPLAYHFHRYLSYHRPLAVTD